jgi:predicted RNase H-like nuclease (RuvC/YqgF family)
MKPLFPVLFLAALAIGQNSDFEQQKAALLAEKSGIESDIKKINTQIAQTDSIAKEEQKNALEQRSRQKADIERRQGEIEKLNQKLNELHAEIRRERNSITNFQTQIENISATRKALIAGLTVYCRKLENFIKTGLPWDTEVRQERTAALCQDLENSTATAEEGFSRLRAIYTEEIRFGDEVQISSRAITRNNGEIVNANVLRIGNQWIVYQDDSGLLYGVLNKKRNKDGKYEYIWKENLSFEERQAVKNAIDVKLSRKPPQMVVLPLSLSINHQ